MNNNITTVYFDINGILLDFDKTVEVYAGISRENLYELQTEQTFDKNQSPVDIIVDKYLQEGLILNAPEMPEFDIFAEMIEWLENKNINVEFLSTTNNIENINLFKKHLEDWLFNKKLFHKINYVVSSKDKKDYASENTLLIDDSKECISAFDKKGHTIHHTNISRTIGAFKVYFSDFNLEKTVYKYQSLTHTSILSEILEEY